MTEDTINTLVKAAKESQELFKEMNGLLKKHNDYLLQQQEINESFQKVQTDLMNRLFIVEDIVKELIKKKK